MTDQGVPEIENDSTELGMDLLAYSENQQLACRRMGAQIIKIPGKLFCNMFSPVFTIQPYHLRPFLLITKDCRKPSLSRIIIFYFTFISVAIVPHLPSDDGIDRDVLLLNQTTAKAIPDHILGLKVGSIYLVMNSLLAPRSLLQ